MDLNQPNRYKVLVVPRAHRETIYDLDDDLAAAIFQVTVKLSRAVRAVSGCDGLNIIQANGRAGQQDVFHFHLHILPRFFDDSIVFGWDFTQSDRDELDQLAADIRTYLQ